MDKKEKKSGWLVVLLIFFIIISLGLASYIVYDKYNTKKDDSKDIKTITNKKDNENNINESKDTNTKSVQGYYVGSKNISINEENVSATVKIALFDDNNAVISVEIPEVDSNVYKGKYLISSDDSVTLTLDKQIWNSGELTDLSPIKTISIKKNDASYIYNLGNDNNLPDEDIYLNKTSDRDIKEKLDDLYKQFNN